MGTRALINIEGVDFASIYKHWDGYPEGMMDWLEDFNSKFSKNRGDDPEYKFAQLIRYTGKYDKDWGIDDSETTGYGVVPHNAEVWQDYTYTLHADGTVTHDGK